jgi:hypothetical protein
MVDLAQDMDRIATGLWHEDYDLIRQGAYNIAQPPKIPPSQLATLKTGPRASIPDVRPVRQARPPHGHRARGGGPGPQLVRRP